MLAKIRIVLVNTTHPGNIGAAARAMKNMGLTRLYLVEPRQFPHADATARASGADDLLAQAQLCRTLKEAVAGCQLVLGTSARSRRLTWPTCEPREAAQLAADCGGEVAVVFGREHAGLTNEELERCHYLLTIPTNPHYSSLNVAAAVQVVSYELRVAALAGAEGTVSAPSNAEKAATADEMERFYEHLEQALVDVAFLDPANPRLVMRRLRRLFNRAQPLTTEVNILRGILTAAQKQSRRSGR